MKIYTKIIIDISTNKILYEDSYEYAGLIGMLSFKQKKLKKSVPSVDETKLTDARSDLLLKQIDKNNELIAAIEKDIASIAGREKTTVSEFEALLPSKKSQAELDLEKVGLDIEKEASDKTLKALRGEVDADPAVEEEIKDLENTLNEKLRRQLGPGYETSSAGIEALSSFDNLRLKARSRVRKDALKDFETVALNRGTSRRSQRSSDLSTIQAFANIPTKSTDIRTSLIGAQLPTAQVFNTAIEGTRSGRLREFETLKKGKEPTFGIGLGPFRVTF